jgi:nitrite reductase/ring-hydroxylating ferredoxin subunit/uncharacterized membrane protein
MKSKVSVKGHPLHPMLIPFPFAFLTGAVIFHALGWMLPDETFWTTGHYLIPAGIAAGLLAAVPGIVDYAAVVPPRSSGKRRAGLHALSNVGALLLFGLAWWFRAPAPVDASLPVFATELAALTLLSAGGWMGGTLVYRNQIAVDHRYAHAGKWREETIDGPADGEGTAIGRADQLQVNQMKLLHVSGRRVALARTERGYAAFDDRCTHRGGSLADGALICGTVQCPWHGSQFDVRTGEVKAGPADEWIEAWEVREAGGELHLRFAANAATRRSG